MKKRRDQKQPAVNPKQPPLPLGFVATVEVEKPHFDPKPRWLPTPDHVFGKQVAVRHPRFGEPHVLEVVDRDNEFAAREPKRLNRRHRAAAAGVAISESDICNVGSEAKAAAAMLPPIAAAMAPTWLSPCETSPAATV